MSTSSYAIFYFKKKIERYTSKPIDNIILSIIASDNDIANHIFVCMNGKHACTIYFKLPLIHLIDFVFEI